MTTRLPARSNPEVAPEVMGSIRSLMCNIGLAIAEGCFRHKSVPSTRGRIAIVTNARRDAVDASASARKVAAGRGKPVSGSHRAG
jgi:hypothetical protein